jgi:aminoglycoside phosphotransferase (APT) family kinase protein
VGEREIAGAAIEQAVTDATGRRVTLASGPEPLAGGLSALLVAFRLADPPPALAGELVLRIPADERGAARELTLQRAVADAGYPAPPVLLMDLHGTNALGRPFLVMPRVAGAPLFADAGPVEVLRGFRQVPGLLAGLMADLHALDAAPVVDALGAAGVAEEDLGAAALLADLDRQPGSGPDLVRNWLEAARPGAADAAVCHGDLHALNVLADGERRTVVDWELATVGDPALDVARTALMLAAVPVEMPRAVRPLVQRLGRGAARRFVAAYRDRRPLAPAALDWYEVAHAARILARLSARDDRADAVLDAWEPTAPYLRTRVEQVSGLRTGPVSRAAGR